MAPKFYKHSGGFNPIGVIIGLAVGLGIAYGASFAYAYLSEWIPLIYLRALFLAGLVFATGFALGMLGNLAKVRNTGLLAGLGLLIGGGAVYAEWVAFFHANLNSQALLLDPGLIWSVMGRMAESGAWEIFGWTPTGGALWAFWIVEAAIIVLGTLMIGMGMLDDPFCEKTNAWAEAKVAIQPLAVPDDLGAFAAQVAQDPQRALADWGEPDDDDEPVFLRAQIAYVEGQEERCDHFLSLELVTLAYDEDGDVQESTTPVMPHLVIDRSTAEALLQV